MAGLKQWNWAQEHDFGELPKYLMGEHTLVAEDEQERSGNNG